MREEENGRNPYATRFGYRSTGGSEVYLDDREVVTVTAVTTAKHGACLLLRTRDGEKIWIVDDSRARTQLRLGSAPDILRNRTYRRDEEDGPDEP